ncbi:MAG: hypothetical protein IGR92_07575 [Leptolyngbyaceae cyanobacterium T60_A2020_046]|nr:hypothetical protein [Leptolyngbyaceae cyanobacterium T60_A2020_046]
MQCDERWSFVDNKGNQPWVWLALDADTVEMIGAHGGRRGRDSAQQRWRSLPSGYRQGAALDTDAWEAYQGGTAIQTASSGV